MDLYFCLQKNNPKTPPTIPKKEDMSTIISNSKPLQPLQQALPDHKIYFK